MHMRPLGGPLAGAASFACAALDLLVLPTTAPCARLIGSESWKSRNGCLSHNLLKGRASCRGSVPAGEPGDKGKERASWESSCFW